MGIQVILHRIKLKTYPTFAPPLKICNLHSHSSNFSLQKKPTTPPPSVTLSGRKYLCRFSNALFGQKKVNSSFFNALLITTSGSTMHSIFISLHVSILFFDKLLLVATRCVSLSYISYQFLFMF